MPKSWQNWTETDVAARNRQVGGGAPSPAPTVPGSASRLPKYRNQKVTWMGQQFDSKRELDAFLELLARAKAGEIVQLERQVLFKLRVGRPEGESVIWTDIGTYTADFTYRERGSGTLHVLDAKGVRTQLFNRTKRHFEAQYGLPLELL